MAPPEAIRLSLLIRQMEDNPDKVVLLLAAFRVELEESVITMVNQSADQAELVEQVILVLELSAHQCQLQLPSLPVLVAAVAQARRRLLLRQLLAVLADKRDYLQRGQA
jgi:hypothetical protein